jgi:hypothetical protein
MKKEFETKELNKVLSLKTADHAETRRQRSAAVERHKAVVRGQRKARSRVRVKEKPSWHGKASTIVVRASHYGTVGVLRLQDAVLLVGGGTHAQPGIERHGVLIQRRVVHLMPEDLAPVQVVEEHTGTADGELMVGVAENGLQGAAVAEIEVHPVGDRAVRDAPGHADRVGSVEYVGDVVGLHDHFLQKRLRRDIDRALGEDERQQRKDGKDAVFHGRSVHHLMVYWMFNWNSVPYA